VFCVSSVSFVSTIRRYTQPQSALTNAPEMWCKAIGFRRALVRAGVCSDTRKDEQDADAAAHAADYSRPPAAAWRLPDPSGRRGSSVGRRPRNKP